jgi:hypothetical protein
MTTPNPLCYFMVVMRLVRSSLILSPWLLLGPSILPSTPVRAEDVPQENAALKYWQAFAEMPDLTWEVSGASTIQGIVSPVTEELIKSIQYSEKPLRLLHRGAKMPLCDWQVDLTDAGFETSLPHLDRAQRLSRLSLLRARYRFEQGHEIEAVEDILATMALARHISRDKTVQGFERSWIVETVAVFVVSAYLPGMSTEALDALAVRLNSLPLRTPLQESVVNERKSLEWFIAKIERTDEKRIRGLLSSLLGSKEKAEILLKTSGGPEGLHKLAVAMLPLYGEAARLPLLPFSEKDLEQRFQQKINDNPLARLLFIADLHSVRIDGARVEYELALLKAAIAVVKGGKESLQNHHDPNRPGVFEYEQLNGGFLLRSQWKYPERPYASTSELVPVTLTVGIRKN